MNQGRAMSNLIFEIAIKQFDLTLKLIPVTSAVLILTVFLAGGVR